eukprot:7823812-Pyramimonas_sp.AAC.1
MHGRVSQSLLRPSLLRALSCVPLPPPVLRLPGRCRGLPGAVKAPRGRSRPAKQGHQGQPN